MFPGYSGQILSVNLTSGQITVINEDPCTLRSYVGGTGLGIRLLSDTVSPGTQPLAPANRIVFATGPLTGSGAPGSGNYSVITRSPLSGFAVSAQSNGHFGAALKRAGFDAVIFSGASSAPVYLLLDDGQAGLRDAGELWGKDTFDTEDALKRMHAAGGAGAVRVACIGPAGENMVPFASVENDHGHIAASGGVGAVMGSKRLKAVVVKGRGLSLQSPADSRSFRDVVKEWGHSARQSGLGRTVDTLGSAGLFSPYYRRGWVPVKNLTANIFPEYQVFDGVYLRERYEGRRGSCFACPMNHCRRIAVDGGKFAGLQTEEPEYESLAGWGPNIGNRDPVAAFYLNELADRLGMDLKESTFLVSLLMECYESGNIGRSQLAGLDLRWGNVDAVAALLNMTARREGVGEVLAGGVRAVARWIGGDAADRAVYVKRGYAPHVHDCRTRWGTLFTQAISPMGSQQGIDLTDKGSPDIGVMEAVGWSETGIPLAEARSGPKRQFEDCLGVCFFVCRGPGGLAVQLAALNALTGWDMSVGEALAVGERVINVLRLFNNRFGHTVEDDCVSPRLLQPPREGPGAGQSMGASLKTMVRVYYQAMGWDPDTGVPLPETLQRLGIWG